MPYRPPGGRDWNKNGTYDWSDRLKDYRAYEIVTGNKHPLDPAGKNEPWRSGSTCRSGSSTQKSFHDPYSGSQCEQSYSRKLTSPDANEESRQSQNAEYELERLKELTYEFSPEHQWKTEYTLDEKKELLRNCNFAIKPYYLPWEFTVRHPDKGYEISAVQLALSGKYCELLTELLQIESQSQSPHNLEELMIQSCELCKKLCKSSEELFSETFFYRKILDEMTPSVAGNTSVAEKVLTAIKEMDKAYKTIGGVQILCMERIMNCMDMQRFLAKPSLQNKLVEVADAYNQMWYAYVKRYTEFYLCPGEDTVLTHWRCYESIIKGLPQYVINGLNESGWNYLLKEMETTFHMFEFVNTFRQNRAAKREARLKQDLADAKRRLEAEKPNVYKEITKMELQVSASKKTLEAERAIGDKMESEIRRIKAEMSTNRDKRKDNQKQIWELDRKFFGKKKNRETIGMLEQENARLQKVLDEAEKRMQELERVYRNWEKSYEEQQACFSKLDRQLISLKEKNGYPVV